MVQFPVVAWRLHRDGIIMVSCSPFYGVYMMSLVSVMFLCPSRNDGVPHRNCTLYTRVIHQEMMVDCTEIVLYTQE